MIHDLVFLHSGHAPRCDARVDKHFDGYWTLQFMSSGGVEVCYDDASQVMEGAWFWTAFPGPHVRFHPAPGYSMWHHRYCAFRGPLVGRWLAEGLFPPEPQHAPNLKRNVSAFDELLAELRRSDRWGAVRALNLLERILIELAEARSPANAPRAWLRPVLDRLEQPGEPPDYERLAEKAGMGLSTLRRRFRQAMGTPLHAYALQCRVAKARSLLGETDLPIKAVAEKLGYSDVYFFSRQFRELSGVPPAAYRKSRQG